MAICPCFVWVSKKLEKNKTHKIRKKAFDIAQAYGEQNCISKIMPILDKHVRNFYLATYWLWTIYILILQWTCVENTQHNPIYPKAISAFVHQHYNPTQCSLNRSRGKSWKNIEKLRTDRTSLPCRQNRQVPWKINKN